ncbi:MAG: ISNCY family transposase [Deltaproteobacteria bacterium]|nr:MAG: ISNCY family transposase [Deltaproteobacteria bacterium]
MRHSVRDQLPLVPAPFGHEHIRELQAVRAILDAHPEFAKWVQADLLAGGIDPGRGRNGMSGEQVLRALVIKQMNGFSYEDLAFHLADSQSYRAFCLIGFADKPPKKSTLQRNLKQVRAETLERVNRVLVAHAQQQEIEDGQRLRSDATVIKAAIHEPTDSSLLVDCVRVLTRLLREARKYVTLEFTNHLRRAKRRALAIQHAAKAEQRLPLYRDLVKVTEHAVDAAQRSVETLEQHFPPEAFEQPELHELRTDLNHYVKLTNRVLDQTRRRIFEGESVPATQKVVSIFEPHTDIIRKDRRDTLYGHKVFLTGGASGLIVDCFVERGNPADSTKAVKLAERAIKVLGKKPEQIVLDGGFSSRDNLDEIKALGIRDVAFSKAPGLSIKEMVKRTWLYQRLRNFRAGIEGVISFLKRCFGWDRCAWRSYESFRAYTWGSVIAANLVLLARHSLN